MNFNEKASQKYPANTVPVMGIGVKADFDTVPSQEELNTDISEINQLLAKSIHVLRTDDADVQQADVIFTIGHHGLQLDFCDLAKPDSEPFHSQYFGFGSLPVDQMEKFKISTDPDIKSELVRVMRTALDLNLIFNNDGLAEAAASRIFELWYHHEVLANPSPDQTYFLPYGSNHIS